MHRSAHDMGEVPDDFTQYELSRREKELCTFIRQQLEQGYEEQDDLRNHMDMLEQLVARIEQILRDEQTTGYRNVTLEHDLSKVKALLGRLRTELDRIDPVE